jgi:hypothetical protein
VIVECQIFALALFISVFAAVAVRVARRGARSYDRDAGLPLENDHVRAP